MVEIIYIVDVSPEFRGEIFGRPWAVMLTAVGIHPRPVCVRKWFPAVWMRRYVRVAFVVGGCAARGKILSGQQLNGCGSLVLSGSRCCRSRGWSYRRRCLCCGSALQLRFEFVDTFSHGRQLIGYCCR